MIIAVRMRSKFNGMRIHGKSGETLLQRLFRSVRPWSATYEHYHSQHGQVWMFDIVR
jgi:hypothetical protein